MDFHRSFLFMSVFEFVVMGLATWRIASVVASEVGPGDMFLRLRNWLSSRQGFWLGIGKGVSCVWCLSVWIAIAWVIAAFLIPDYAFWIALPFAISAVAIVVEGVQGWLEQATTRS